MPISRADLTKQLIPGLHDIIGLSYAGYENEHEQLFDKYSSNRSFEEEVLMSGLGEAAVKPEGTGVAFDDAQEAWAQRYQHETIALAFSITEEAMEDELYDTYSKMRAEALGRSMASTKQQKAADVYNNGFSTYLLGDGQPLFSASHPLVNGGTLDNLDDADLSETALESAIINIAAYVDDRGILINANAKSLHIPMNLYFTAFEILRSDKSTTTATLGTDGITNTNNVNPLNAGGFFPGGMHVNHRFTDTDGWFIRTDVTNGPKYFERVGLSIKEEGDFTTGNLRIKARERYSFGVTDPRSLYGSDGSAT